jgi:hypothetical protein
MATATLEELEKRILELEKIVERLVLLLDLSNTKGMDSKKLPI